MEDGFWQYYHENGQLQEMGYKEANGIYDLKKGVWRTYSESGVLLSIKTYNIDYKENKSYVTGPRLYYDKTGAITGFDE